MPNDLITVKVLEGRQDAGKYIETLKRFGVSIMKLNIKHKICRVQDNCRIHVANGYTLVYRLRLNKNLEYTKYRQKYIESEYISHFGRK